MTSGDVDAFLRRYDATIASQLRAARATLSRLVPRGYELVYDNYNALVFAYGPTTRTSNAIVSIAGYPRWVTLFFAQGDRLDDPTRVLQGDGKRIRSVRLQPPDVLTSPAVRALLEQALGVHARALADAPRLATIVKSVATKQRPRRPAAAGARGA